MTLRLSQSGNLMISRSRGLTLIVENSANEQSKDNSPCIDTSKKTLYETLRRNRIDLCESRIRDGRGITRVHDRHCKVSVAVSQSRDEIREKREQKGYKGRRKDESSSTKERRLKRRNERHASRNANLEDYNGESHDRMATQDHAALNCTHQQKVERYSPRPLNPSDPSFPICQ